MKRKVPGKGYSVTIPASISVPSWESRPTTSGFHQALLDFKCMSRLINNPEHPFLLIVGGARLSEKAPVLNAYIDQRVDKILVGGAIAYTFLKAYGFTVGKSLVENHMLEMALEIKKRADDAEIEILLPTDHQVVDSYEPLKNGNILTKTIPIEFTNAGHVGMDIGVETVLYFSNILAGARTIVWSGPMGVFEQPPFDQGTMAIARALSDAAERGAMAAVTGSTTREFLTAADLPRGAALIQYPIA